MSLIQKLQQTAETLEALCDADTDYYAELDIAQTVEALCRQAARRGLPVPEERPLLTARDGLIIVGKLLAAVRQPPALLSVEEVAQTLGISARTVWRRVSAGELPQPIKVGGSTKWKRAEIEAHLGV